MRPSKSSLVAISELYEGLFDGPHATPAPAVEGPVFLGISNVTEDGHLDLSSIRHIAEDDFPKWTRRVEPRAGDLVFTYEATLNRYAIIPNGFRGCLGRRMALIRPNLARVDPRFLHYYFFTPEWREVVRKNTLAGATVDRLPLTKFPEFPVRVPSLSEQRRIARVLAAYDGLIDNSKRRIGVLERMARALYREWFVLFRYPGAQTTSRMSTRIGRVPRDWVLRSPKEIAEVQYGFPFKSALFSEDSAAGTPVVRIRDIPVGRSETYTTEPAASRYEIQNGDVLVGMDGDFHMCIWSSGRALQNQRVARFRPSGEWSALHLLLALTAPVQALNRAIIGTTVAHLGDSHIRGILLGEPPPPVLARAKEVFEPIGREIATLQQRIRNLRATRDLLLPRLMAGQLSAG
ncbi:restriction endonuclease subunit S [Anaeromyxobacter dehalogenans]|uniref:Type I restriction-modification system specificity subunit n=1 Tax=Anaeromyxobacter dehalogenans (strain 2CP-C) TaxID=290397 RepID=Q2IKB6_ANADE|nr:restriction endonuclease subunit S [Anaeromyxobacter dehalogenans]ABC82098.1 type I restriction-modification system specificity subunit [Anaeromyxobacter dehalogenans 2CP-C]